MGSICLQVRSAASRDIVHLSSEGAGASRVQEGAAARSDGARAVFVVPTSYSAGYWKGLRARSTGQLEHTNPQIEFHNPQGTMGNHTVFLVDFPDADIRLPACCGQEGEPRGRRSRLGPEEQLRSSRCAEEQKPNLRGSIWRRRQAPKVRFLSQLLRANE